MPDSVQDVDLVIVGAGMAGLYTALRVRQHDAARSIVVLEALPRTGGRLETDHIVVNGTTVKAEEGGMRFLTSHVELVSLLAELALSKYIVPFPMGDGNNVYFLRGQRFTRGDAEANPSRWSQLYALDAASNGLQPGAILSGLLQAVLQENGATASNWKATPPDWTRLRLQFTFRGVPMFQWGFWAMLTEYGLSTDAIEMLYQSSGFIAPYDQEINAGCALQLLVDFVNPSFQTLGPGYETLPNTLAALVTSRGANIRTSHLVVGLERQSDQRLLVTAATADGSHVRFMATNVVFGSTQIALNALVPFVPMFRESPTFHSDVAAVTDMALGKVNLYFDSNWWTPATGVWSGGSFTDLPLAQFYCFGESAATPTNVPASITIYTDYYRTGYWAQLQRLGQPYSVANGPQLPPTATAASTRVVEQAMEQLRQMLGVTAVPAPVAATYRRWGVAPAGDADHQWRIGVRDDVVRARMANPFPNVFTCGETWSDDQCWVNGALRSCNDMLPLLLR